MTSIKRGIGLAVVLVAMTVGAASALAAKDGQNPSKLCGDENVFVVEIPGEGSFPLEIPSHGGCVSSYAKGELSNAAYVANCKALEQEFGGYPYSFYGIYEARNRADCKNFLRAFHTGEIQPPAGA